MIRRYIVWRNNHAYDHDYSTSSHIVGRAYVCLMRQ